MDVQRSHLESTPQRAGITAMVLAAGRGERMRPLTDAVPKPLLSVRGKPLIQWPLEALARGACQQVIINTAWLGEQLSTKLGSVFVLQPSSNKADALSIAEHSDNQLPIHYSHEGRDFGTALETAGGISRVLPQLGEVFWVLAGDVYAPDFVFSPAAVDAFVASDKLAHIWLVPNPEHNPKGDFGFAPLAPANGDPATSDCHGLALNLPAPDPAARWTYSTIGLYRRALFAPPWCDIAPGNPMGVKAPLVHLLRAAMDQQWVSASIYHGAWTDVGTPQRLAQLNTA